MKRPLFLFLLAVSSFSFAGEPTLVTGPVYDKEGHLLQYVYPDQSQDLYAYDSAWRITEFQSRTGEVTKYAYRADGSMITLKSSDILEVKDQ